MGKSKTRLSFHALKRKVALRGLKAVDQRTLGGKALLSWRDELQSALGGLENLSPQEATLIELVARKRLLLDSIDGHLFSLPTLLKDGALDPLVIQRLQLDASIERTLDRLGLKRREKPVQSLQEYLASSKEEPDENDSASNE